MTIEEFKELIIANTLKGWFPDERWGIQFPKEAWDEDTESVDLSKAKPYWVQPGRPGFGLYAGYDYILVRGNFPATLNLATIPSPLVISSPRMKILRRTC